MEENINNLIPSYISDISKIGYNPNLLASPFSVSEPNINDMSNSNFNPNIKGSSYVRGLAGKRNGSQYKTNTSLIASSDEQYYVLSGKREGDNIVLEKDIYEVHIRGRRSANSLSPIIANSDITGKREGGADLIFDANGNIIDSRRPIGGGNIDLDNNDLIKGKRGLGNQLIDTSNDSGDLGEISNRNGNNLNNGLIDNNPGDSSGDGLNNGNGNNNNNGLDNNSGNENNSGTGSGDGSGNGSGDGTGNGSGDGTGNGSGDGTGNGSGDGTGNSNGSNNSNLNYNDGRFGDGSNNGSNRNDRGSGSGDRGEGSSNSQNNDSFLDRLGNDALQYLLNGLLSSLFGRGNGELQDRYITVPYLQQELCGECFGLLNLSEANFGGAFLNGTPVTAFPEDSTELSNMAASALLDAADAAVATTLNGINAIKQIANGNFEELGQELITATVKKVTEVSGQFVGTALNIVTTSVINIPAKITDASMTYFYTYKSTLGEMIKEVTTSLESQAEENVKKEDKEREAKKVKDVQEKIDNFNKGVIFFSNMATEYAGMVNSYLHMGPEWVADKLDGVCVTILGQIHKYTMGQVQTITDAIDDFCEKQGEKAGKILVEVYNAALRFIAIQTVQLSKKIIALSLSTAVAILQEVILKLMALLGVPLPVPPLASLLPTE
jgi:hypothetical protein